MSVISYLVDMLPTLIGNGQSVIFVFHDFVVRIVFVDEEFGFSFSLPMGQKY